MGNLIVPSSRELKAIKMDLEPTGNLTRCIEAGFLKGTVSGQQASGLKQCLTNLVDYAQAQQGIIFELQAELARSKQATLFTV